MNFVRTPDLFFHAHFIYFGQMKQTERFATFKEAVNYLIKERNFTNQEATHYVWDNHFKMGTDWRIWLTIPSDRKS